MSPGATNNGGGVLNEGSLILTRSTVSGNSAGLGGGVSSAGALTLIQTLVSGNTAPHASTPRPVCGNRCGLRHRCQLVLGGHDGQRGVSRDALVIDASRA
ncbi:MAG: hypothetical protein ACREXX_09815 [Gammaproteobacteria bacterium]